MCVSVCVCVCYRYIYSKYWANYSMLNHHSVSVHCTCTWSADTANVLVCTVVGEGGGGIPSRVRLPFLYCVLGVQFHLCKRLHNTCVCN